MESGYFQVPNFVLDIKDLTAIQKMVLVCFFRAGNHDAPIFPSFKTIARRCSISERTAKKAVRELETMNILIVKRRKIGNQNNTNLYTINLKELESIPVYTKDNGSAPYAPGSAPYAPGVVHHVHPIKNHIYKEPGIKKKPYNSRTLQPAENYDYLAVDLFADDT